MQHHPTISHPQEKLNSSLRLRLFFNVSLSLQKKQQNFVIFSTKSSIFEVKLPLLVPIEALILPLAANEESEVVLKLTKIHLKITLKTHPKLLQ